MLLSSRYFSQGLWGFSAFLLAACTLPVVHTAPAVLRAAVTSPQRNGAQIDVRIALQSQTAAYRTLISTSGQEAAELSDVLSLRIFLIDASLGTPVGTVVPYPTPGDVFTLSTVNSSQNILFTQVPAGQYRVCVAGFNQSTAPFSEPGNLSELGSTTYTEGSCHCSTAGGDGSGRVTVNSDYQLDTSTPLQVNLPLRSATGARLDISATVADG